jgi:hypothetical protein
MTVDIYLVSKIDYIDSSRQSSTGRRKYLCHLEFEFSPLKRTFPIRLGLIVPGGLGIHDKEYAYLRRMVLK